MGDRMTKLIMEYPDASRKAREGIARLLDVAEAARDVLADFDYVNEWGYEAGGKSLDDNLDRLRTALHKLEGGERG